MAVRAVSSGLEIALQFVSAFAGAFFAFLFVRLGQFFTALYDRQRQHINALTALERQFNEWFDVLLTNRERCLAFRGLVKDGSLTWALPRELEIDKDVCEELFTLDTLNRLMGLHLDVERYNRDIEDLCRAYQEVKVAYFFHGRPREEYIANAGGFAERFEEIAVGGDWIERRTRDLLAHVRVRAKRDKPLGARLVALVFRPKRVSDDDLKREREIMDSEIEASKRASVKEMAELRAAASAGRGRAQGQGDNGGA